MGAWHERGFTPCPHCGRRVANSNAARHIAACIADPAVFAVTRAALDDGAGYIKKQALYARTRGAALSLSTLQDQLGLRTWGAIAKHFGLHFSRLHHAPPAPDPDEAAADEPDELDDQPTDRTDPGEAWQRAGVPVCRVRYEALNVTAVEGGWQVLVSETRWVIR